MYNTKYLYSLFLGIIFCGVASAQQSYPVKTSENVKNLMTLKKEAVKHDKSFRIQIFNGNKENADLLSEQLKDNNLNPSFQLFFETPNYKIRSAGFRTRIEAEKYLLKIKENYPGAFIVLS